MSFAEALAAAAGAAVLRTLLDYLIHRFTKMGK